MMTSGEKRGLIALTIVLALIVVFVICRSVLFNTPAGNDMAAGDGSDTVAAGSVAAEGSLRMAADSDSLCVAHDGIISVTADSAARAKSYKKKAGNAKSRSGTKRQAVKREPVIRDPLSQPVN